MWSMYQLVGIFSAAFIGGVFRAGVFGTALVFVRGGEVPGVTILRSFEIFQTLPNFLRSSALCRLAIRMYHVYYH